MKPFFLVLNYLVSINKITWKVENCNFDKIQIDFNEVSIVSIGLERIKCTSWDQNAHK